MTDTQTHDLKVPKACPLCTGEVQVRLDRYKDRTTWVCLHCRAWSAVPSTAPKPVALVTYIRSDAWARA